MVEVQSRFGQGLGLNFGFELWFEVQKGFCIGLEKLYPFEFYILHSLYPLTKKAETGRNRKQEETGRNRKKAEFITC